MKLNKALVLLPLTAMVAYSPVYATASDAGYFGISAGQATVDDFCDGSTSSCDDSSLSFRLYGSTEVNDFTNFEVGYQYIDDVEASGYISGIAVAGEMSGHFVDTTLQFGLPEKGPFRIFSKAGLVLWKLNYEISATDGFISVSESDSDTGVTFRTGMGVSYEISEKVRLRADWDLLLDVGDEDETGEADINIFSVGSEFRF